MSEYGVDLLDYFRGRLTLRRVAVLIKGLPPGNAIDRAVSPEDAAWQTGELTSFLLSASINDYRQANFEKPDLILTPAQQREADAKRAANTAKAQRYAEQNKG